MKVAIIAAALALCATAAAAEPPANLKPRKLINIITAADGSPREYIMGYGGGPDTAIIALLKSPQRQPGPNAMGRLILGVPDAKGLADWLKTQGVDNRQVIPNVAYFISDPEGNAIELYTPPKS